MPRLCIVFATDSREKLNQISHMAAALSGNRRFEWNICEMSQMKEANWIKLTEKKNAEISNCTDCKIFLCKLEILRLQIATGAEKLSFFFTKAAKLFRQDQWHVIKCGDTWIYEIVWNCSPACELYWDLWHCVTWNWKSRAGKSSPKPGAKKCSRRFLVFSKSVSWEKC